MKPLVIDGSNAILGRLASYAAKKALQGHEVIIINCDQVRITGNRQGIILHYQAARRRGGTAQKGPYVYSNPAQLVKRTIRGMVPHHQERGRTAWKRVRCYRQIPTGQPIEHAIRLGHETEAATVVLHELARELGSTQGASHG